MDLVKPGMKELLTAAERARDNEVVDAARATNQNPTIGVEAIQVWRALKKLTEDYSEARQVVISVPGEDGYAAWVKLHRRFGMALGMRQGTMLSNFSQLGSVKMKSPVETRSKVIEIDRMAKLAQETNGEPIGEGHWKSVLVGMLDPLTRQHTSRMMGSQHTAMDLKQAILEFTSNVVLDASSAMQIGGFGQTPSDQAGSEWAGASNAGWEPTAEAYGVNALGKGAPKGGCWICGGQHYAQSCPIRKRAAR